MFSNNLAIKNALAQRNTAFAQFWFSDSQDRDHYQVGLYGKHVVVIDAEDTFTIMLAQQLRSLGLLVEIKAHHQSNFAFTDYALTIMGPGPGDPRDTKNPRIVKMRNNIQQLLQQQLPFLAICLSHQMLCLALEIPLVKRKTPNQGIQIEINLFGKKERVGFYNTYIAECDDAMEQKLSEKNIQVCRDINSHEVYALRGPNFMSMQFHPESLLTCNGVDIIEDNVKRILK